MDLKSKTIDDLQEMLSEVKKEIWERNQEPTKIVYVVRLNDLNDGAVWYKSFQEAKKELFEEINTMTVVDFNNKVSIEPEKIPVTEYNNRPKIWYG